jgi:hypothetical protein
MAAYFSMNSSLEGDDLFETISLLFRPEMLEDYLASNAIPKEISGERDSEFLSRPPSPDSSL